MAGVGSGFASDVAPDAGEAACPAVSAPAGFDSVVLGAAGSVRGSDDDAAFLADESSPDVVPGKDAGGVGAAGWAATTVRVRASASAAAASARTRASSASRARYAQPPKPQSTVMVTTSDANNRKRRRCICECSWLGARRGSCGDPPPWTATVPRRTRLNVRPEGMATERPVWRGRIIARTVRCCPQAREGAWCIPPDTNPSHRPYRPSDKTSGRGILVDWEALLTSVRQGYSFGVAFGGVVVKSRKPIIISA